MQLKDFNTLAEAQAHEVITYKTIPTIKAQQFLLAAGVEDSLHANAENATVIDLGGNPVTVGSICRRVLQNTEGFDIDPTTEIGQFNTGLIQALVALGIAPQEGAIAFSALAQTTTKPYENKTEHDLQVAKGTITTKPVRISANGDYAIMETNAVTPSHPPRLTKADGTAVSNFFNVSLVGEYVCQIPNQHRGVALFVDNAYNAVV